MSKLFAQAGNNGANGMIPEKAVDTGYTWFENIIRKFQLEGWLDKVGITVSEAFTIFSFFAGAFIVGFAFKKYFKFLVSCTVIISVLVIVLESKNLLSVDWAGIKDFVGLTGANSDLNSLWNMIYTWVYENLYSFIGAVIGFIFGYKLG